MNSTDLIERLKVDVENWEFLPAHVVQNMRDAITALSPVMPPEVDAAIKFYRDPEQGANRITADLLEKLARELSQFQDSSFNPDWSLLEAGRESLREHMQLLKEAQQRIEELEPKYQLERQGSARMSEEILKLESQRDQLAEALDNIWKGQYPVSDEEGPLMDEVEYFARAEHKRIMGENCRYQKLGKQIESQRDQLAEELEDQLQYHQEEAVTLENRIEEVVAANDKERARVNKLTSQRDQLAEAIETLGTKGFLSFEDRAAFARAAHKRIMGEK